MKRTNPLYSSPEAFLLASVLAPHMDAYTAHLQLGRYATSTIQGYILGLVHFAHWMAKDNISINLLNEMVIHRFLNDHLPHCDCPSPVNRDFFTLRATLGNLLKVLREQGVIAEQPAPTGDIADELSRYHAYMHNVRGLSVMTCRGRLRTIQRLLLHKFEDRPVEMETLQPNDIRQFVANQLKQVDTISNAKALAAALRDYLGYRATCGDHVDSMLGVISLPANWSLASLPRAIAPADVDRLLESFNAALPSPKRGYAMVRCALDIGLRCSEIASLQLSDIDWRSGTVTLNRTKALRQDILPLPAITGEALADYIRYERPKTTNQGVFVRVYAPHDQSISVDTVHRVIRDAYHRIGLTHGRSHALRHTLACQLVNHGSSLKEVADLLRHRSLNTSLIYAKLDITSLDAVALSWPGSIML
ncbi:MAG TPA: site-specific integrase [Acidithiobacillus sp.]|nr:site-specific integrase [Acidithiobacillus sp.]